VQLIDGRLERDKLTGIKSRERRADSRSARGNVSLTNVGKRTNDNKSDKNWDGNIVPTKSPLTNFPLGINCGRRSAEYEMRAAALSNNQRWWFSFLARKVAGIVRINSGRNEIDVYSRRESWTRNRIVRRSTLNNRKDLPETRKRTFRSTSALLHRIRSFILESASISASATCMPFDLSYRCSIKNERTNMRRSRKGYE